MVDMLHPLEAPPSLPALPPVLEAFAVDFLRDGGDLGAARRRVAEPLALSGADVQALALRLTGSPPVLRRAPSAAYSAAAVDQADAATILGDIARSLTELAPRLLAPAAIANAIESLPPKAFACALALLAVPTADGGARSSALDLLTRTRPADGEVLTHLALFLTQPPSRAHVFGLHQLLGQALLVRRDPQRLAADPLPRMADAQELLTGANAAYVPAIEARGDLAALYREAPSVPELTGFATVLAVRLEAELLAAPAAELAPLVEAMHRWQELPHRRQEQVLKDMGARLGRLMALPSPHVQFGDFYDTPAEGASGTQQRDRGRPGASLIRFNTAGDDPEGPGRKPRLPFRDSFANAMEVLLHEFSHCYDEFLCSGPNVQEMDKLPPQLVAGYPRPRPEDAQSENLRRLFSGNRRCYLSPGTGREAYERQPLEQQAFYTQARLTPRLLAALSLRSRDIAVAPTPEGVAGGGKPPHAPALSTRLAPRPSC